jgi:hypothetical protein
MATTLKISINRLNIGYALPHGGIIRPGLRHFQAGSGVFICSGGP